MFDYLVYRKGSNAANQPMEFGWVPVFCCEAKNRAEAVKLAEEAGVTCYANQILEARPASRCPKSDRLSAWEETIYQAERMAAWEF